MTTRSDFYPACVRVGGRRLWQVRRKPVPVVMVGATVVWSGPGKENCRRALNEWREVERWHTRHFATGRAD